MSEGGIEELINFWKPFNPTVGKPCVHEDDLEAMNKAKKTPPEMSSVRKFFELTSPKQGSHFHLSLSPVPYMGNLRSADIFLLMLNPSTTYADYCTNEDAAFLTALDRTRRQKFEEGEKACLALNPQHCGSSWFCYYEKVFRPTLLEYAETPGVSYWQALEKLSQRLAILELVPYYSANADQITDKFVQGLPSAQKAKKAAQDLCKRAKNSKGITRIEHRSGLGEDGRQAILTRLKSQQHNPADPIVIVRWSYKKWVLGDEDSPAERAT